MTPKLPAWHLWKNWPLHDAKKGGGQKFATQAARRLQNLRDPDAGRSFKMPTPHV